MTAALADLEPQVRARAARLELPASWPVVVYAPTDAYHLVLNLLGNALKFGGRGGGGGGVPPVPTLPAGGSTVQPGVERNPDNRGACGPPHHRGGRLG